MKEDIFKKAQAIKADINHCNANIDVLEKIIDYWEKNNITLNNDVIKKAKNFRGVLKLLGIALIFQLLTIKLELKYQIQSFQQNHYGLH